MSILKIARMGHPVLRQVATPIADPTSPEIKALVQDMCETLDDIQGAGLAAPQVHVSKRLVIFQVPARRTDNEASAVPLQVLINPVIEPQGDEMVETWERCLSVPGLAGLVPRYKSIRYTGLTLAGEQIDRTVDGFHAVVVQHECDHLDGVLYPQRMKNLEKLVFTDEIRHHIEGNDA